MTSKLPTLPTNDEGVLRYCAEAGDLLRPETDVPQEVSRSQHWLAGVVQETQIFAVVGAIEDASAPQWFEPLILPVGRY